MSDSRYSYDDNGEVWPYFAATLLGVVLVPMTGLAVVGSGSSSGDQQQQQKVGGTSGKKGDSKTKEKSEFKPRNYKQLSKFRSSRKSLFTAYNGLIAAGWLVMAGLVYIIIQQRILSASDTSKVTFDPYEILGVSYSASEKEIKSVYRKLSVKLHPDKIKASDLANQTREFFEARYVDITKAYKALTDETVRDNFLKYGHPDGPQQTSHGIALPKFLVEGKGSPIVIALYSSVVGILLPLLVGSWWAGTAIYTKTGIRQTTAGKFFEICAKDQPHFITYDRILEILAQSEELELIGKANKGKLGALNSKQIKQVLEDYLNRRETNEKDIDVDTQLEIVSVTPLLLDGLLDISSAFKSATLCQRVIEVKRCIVQAVPFKDQSHGEFLQIPGVQLDTKAKDSSSASSSSWEKSLSSTELEAARQIPKLHFLNAYFKVPGESVVPPNAQAHLIIKFAVTPLGGSSKPPKPEEFDPVLLEDPVDDDETSKVLREPLHTNDLPPVIPYASAPYFPGVYRPNWYGFIVNEKDNKIIDGPAELTRLSYQNLSLSDKDISSKSADNKLAVATFKIQLTTATPPFPGTFSFKLMLLSSGYFGTDIIESVKMTVENPPAVAETTAQDDEDDISEPEEDSVAGALSQMRGGSVKKRAPTSSSTTTDKNDDDEDESSDDEEDLTDIDTDTEDEEDLDDEDSDAKKNK
ncbi:protein-transporting protein SEC63 [Sugiyamaella lignohabitans]|uniref:Protein-transporting protein SEC63 n=1 Tax=Sugiyamaella lignohabitans TaxID=796027 RepID=A0A161HJZ3_9ASCO|nr:protein-transporting protein SEC63 [Sugiyamaella lignohabitans]ANB11848.1 protein-transporting protein SEC63 [Sugiyamaella lignohabitans]